MATLGRPKVGVSGMAGLGRKAAIAKRALVPLPPGMDWSVIAQDFQYDGSLRDIYILDTSIDDWAHVWAALVADSESLSFEADGVAMKPPADVRNVFALGETRSVNASYRLGKQQLNCHFFTETEVEFDLDPRDVDGPVEAERLAHFLLALGRATSKAIRLTPENGPEAIIARYDPSSDSVVWLPITS